MISDAEQRSLALRIARKRLQEVEKSGEPFFLVTVIPGTERYSFISDGSPSDELIKNFEEICEWEIKNPDGNSNPGDDSR